jgi:hypothetical protein
MTDMRWLWFMAKAAQWDRNTPTEADLIQALKMASRPDVAKRIKELNDSLCQSDAKPPSS